MSGVVELKHGAGGAAMRALVTTLLAPPEAALGVGAVGPGALDDGAAIPFGDRWLVLTTDGHVVKPIFFAGGDIGRLAISGVVNDLAMMGATEILGLTSSVIIEEGFSLDSLERIHQSMREASRGVCVRAHGRYEGDGARRDRRHRAVDERRRRDRPRGA